MRRWPAVLLVLLPVLWWWPLLTGLLPDYMDTVSLVYPLRVAVARQLHAGTLPLWLPEQMCGMPLAADPEVAAWYPPQWLFFLWPTPLANGLICLFHYLLAGFGAYALGRSFGLGRASSYFGAFTFQFGAFLVSHLAVITHLYAVPWIPWILLAVERAVRSRSRDLRGPALVGAAMALQVLSGAPQIAFYTDILVAIYWTVRAWQVYPGTPVRRTFRLGSGAAIAVAMLVGLAAILLVPAAELLRESERHGIGTEKLQQGALAGEWTWRAIVGGTGEAVEDTDTTNAIGLGALALVPLAFVRRRQRGVAFLLLALGGVFFLLSLAVLVPLWAKVLPMYGNFHAPRRALLMWSVVGPIMAALGAESLRGLLRRHAMGATLHGAALGLLACGTILMLDRLERNFTSPDRFEPHPDYVAAIGSARFLAIDPTFRYAYDSRRYDYGDSLMPNVAAWHGLFDPQGNNPLVLRRYGRLRGAQAQPTGVIYPSHGWYLTDASSPVLRLLAVQYLVGRYDLFDPSRIMPGTHFDPKRVEPMVELVSEKNWRWPLHRYREDRPLAWAVERVEGTANEEAALESAFSGEPYRTAYVEGGPLFMNFVKPTGLRIARSDARTFQLSLEGVGGTGAFVCISTVWAPGWQASGPDGELLETRPADGVLVGVFVPPGVSEITVKYAPPSFRNGSMITLAGLLALLLCFYRCKR